MSTHNQPVDLWYTIISTDSALNPPDIRPLDEHENLLVHAIQTYSNEIQKLRENWLITLHQLNNYTFYILREVGAKRKVSEYHTKVP